jgi:hypothetical protein
MTGENHSHYERCWGKNILSLQRIEPEICGRPVSCPLNYNELQVYPENITNKYKLLDYLQIKSKRFAYHVTLTLWVPARFVTLPSVIPCRAGRSIRQNGA